MLKIPQETNPWPSFHLESYESFIQQLNTRCLIVKDIKHRWVSTAIGLWQAIYTACSFSITQIKINGNVGVLDCEESWAPKNWCFWTVVLEKTLESPLDCKEIQPVHSEGDQPWVFFERNDAKAETLVLWPPHAKSWLIGKEPDAGSDWGQEEKGATEDGMAGWHHRLDGRESEWNPGVGDGQEGLACCDSWGRKASDMTERLKWTELNWRHFYYPFSSLMILDAINTIQRREKERKWKRDRKRKKEGNLK